MPGRRGRELRASVAVAAGKAPLPRLEGASEELRAAAAQSLDWAPARRRVRGAFAPVLPTLDHCLFKVPPLLPVPLLGAAVLDPLTSSPCACFSKGSEWSKVVKHVSSRRVVETRD
uniref:Uncharacterized protein n=1 Tax=Triticum aestivum TaxID=4565 RepID=A0A077S2B8_WHEAT|nr:unnamed protein product [Triticum aestivum]